METRLRLLALVLFLVCFGFGASLPAGAQGNGAPDVVVKVNPGVSIDQLAADYHTSVDDHIENSDVYSLLVPRGSTVDAFVLALQGDSRVVYVESDEMVAAPEFIGDPMHLPFDHNVRAAGYVSQSAYKQIKATNLSGAATGAGVIVAVLDTGANLAHPALAGHLTTGYNAISSGADPLDIADGTTNFVAGHGTMVAGLIARLAPNAAIMPIRVLNGDGVGRLMDIVKGLNYAVSHGARVVNMSFGSPVSSDSLNEAIDACERAGVICVAAVGNNGSDTRQYPAANSYVLSVVSVESNDHKSIYSNYGVYAQISAPGTAIRSTFFDGGYATWSGTSFAAPFVSIGAAIVLSAHPGWRADTVIEALTTTARPVDKVNRPYKGKIGKGVINVQNALKFEG